ncbi:uncharacterized protein LOC127787396 [Diospyros lotus]|uniref:uncharacterized protein LOC127787396 n=1 Tax=Diospyros lotus TaxID=55363 RepID=UPI0022582458|nr:uncharacterized protein LOC127787396 [Diospyros lotus]
MVMRFLPELQLRNYQLKSQQSRGERFFQHYNIPEGQRINLAAAYLNDTADSWYQGWNEKRRREANWTEFVKDLCDRFGEKTMTDVVEEFNKLQQDGSVTEYQIRFEELRSLMLNSQPALTTGHYFVSSFISGLKDEPRPIVKMMQAAEKAKLQELTLEAIFNKYTISMEIQPLFYQPLERNQVNVNSKVYPKCS